jgi:hypothetical protein
MGTGKDTDTDKDNAMDKSTDIHKDRVLQLL